MKRLLPALMLILLLPVGAAVEPRSGEAEPLVRVNDHTITTAEVELFLKVNYPVNPGADAGPVPMEYEQLENQRRKEALQALVRKHLLLDAARKKFVLDESVQEALDAFAERELEKVEDRVGSRLRVRKMLHDRGLTLQQFKELQTETLLVARLLWREVYSEIKVSPAELRQYYDEHPEEFRQAAKVRYRQILFPVVEGADAVRQQAERVMDQLEQGADFAELADRWSADSETYPGGLHEVQLPPDAPDWRPQAVAGLEEGETSGVRRVTGGFAITRLERVVPARVLSFEEAQPRIRAQLTQRKRAEAEEAYVERLRGRAVIKRFPAAERLGA